MKENGIGDFTMKDLQDFVKERPQIPESVSHILSLSTEWQETDSQNDNHDFEIAGAEQSLLKNDSLESKIQEETWTIEWIE